MSASEATPASRAIPALTIASAIVWLHQMRSSVLAMIALTGLACGSRPPTRPASPPATSRPAARTPVELTVTRFRDDIRPRLLASATDRLLGADPEFVKLMLAVEPEVLVQQDSTGLAIRQLFTGMADAQLKDLIVAGSLAALEDHTSYAVVWLQLRTAGTPAVGVLVLLFVTPRERGEIAMAIRLLGG
jgi:hypothetical protein